MARLLRMPEVAANTLEATLSEWSLAEGAAFSDGDPIATVETDKAAVDVPAEGDGVMVRTLVRPGTTVAVGAPMALIAEPGEEISDVDAVLAELGGAPAGPAAVATPAPVAAGTNGGRVLSSPLARRLVREHGLALADLTGTGPGGRIVRDDVRRAVAAREAGPAGAPAVPDFEPAFGSAAGEGAVTGGDPATVAGEPDAGPAFAPVPGPDASPVPAPVPGPGAGPAPAAAPGADVGPALAPVPDVGAGR
ncbi:MAG TPA: E3 binding domain-containing protein, partial [Mycobacteriales bacterium]|nr:E3 binding domain-containing protein [Mycobacteriales bacterium]